LDPAGWGGTVMGWLRVATQMVALNLLWWLGLLLGLVLLGALPATGAVHELSRRSRRDPSMRLWRDFWALYRRLWRRAAAPGALLSAVVLLGAVDLVVLLRAPGAMAYLLVPVLVISVLAGLALCYATPLLTAGEGPVLVPAAALAVVSPLTSLAMALTAAGTAVLAWRWPLVGVLVGASLPLAAMTLLARERLLRTGALGVRQAGEARVVQEAQTS
ncbi:DUF624 domain-containing protein, partial [Actinomyces sp. 217892]